eukprot:TRINITY_DN1493_c0_g1_i1.p1 TRINITY_DN1493_c0_g1~~TRINITY_DN1493_c0_g1_i1.p1  ORF type:complete len:264 (-),score=24.24 TRINITY_DN1493_c0_g1_i1:73-864(-)
MADLFHKQAKEYAESRPSYPADLFRFIASKTPTHGLAWDVGTGSGQAAVTLAEIYKQVVATDTSMEQIAMAPKLPNIRYQHTPPTISIDQLARDVAPHASVDLVTVAQALHWFHLPSFYQQLNWVLRRPHGVIAAWCYTTPKVDLGGAIDATFDRIYAKSAPFWDPARRLVDGEYRDVSFPFEAVEGTNHTGPFEFEGKQSMDLDAFLTYIRSWSAYQTARDNGVELLGKEVVLELERGWGDDRGSQKIVTFPIHLRIGRVGN